MADWAWHKPACLAQRAFHVRRVSLLPPTKGLEQANVKPFTRLDNGTWLHDRPEKDVYRLLIDAYRLRAEDDLVYEDKRGADSIYAGQPDSLEDFRRFLARVEAAGEGALLPSW